MGIRFPADPNRELPSCRRASEEKQGINRQEPGVGGLTKTEMTSSPFQRFSRKYSKEEISLEIVLKGRDSDIPEYQSCTVHGLNLAERGTSRCVKLPEQSGPGRTGSGQALPRGEGGQTLGLLRVPPHVTPGGRFLPMFKSNEK